MHRIVEPPRYIYPLEDEWKMTEQRFSPLYLAQLETICTLANGYLGMRAVFEEGSPAVENGTFINGFFEYRPIIYGEEAYGFPKTSECMLNVTDGKIIKLYVDGDAFELPQADILDFRRILDLRSAALDREVVWETAIGKRLSVKSRRLVFFRRRHLAAVVYEVTMLNEPARLTIASEMIYRQDGSAEEWDPRRARGFVGRVLHPVTHTVRDCRIILCHETHGSQMILACGMDHELQTECEYSYDTKCEEDFGAVIFSVDARPGEPVRLVKYLSYHTSGTASCQELCFRTEMTLDRGLRRGFANLLADQREYMDRFWYNCGVEIAGELRMKRAMHWNLFQLLQASARADGAGIGAKGLTGQAYEGHYFWDIEIYVLPFLIYTTPRIARSLLKFRYKLLDKARARARELGHRGALYPWRTIAGGESSAYYAASTAQYHINAAIAYGLRKYVTVTGDERFLYEYGAEILVETARLWADLGFYSDYHDRLFCINGVTGPDEYNTVVNNNYYTNLMARENLWYAAATVAAMRREHPEHFAILMDRTGLDPAEIETWRQAADRMYLPYDKKRDIHPQDDSFLEKEPWDFANTPDDKYPLLLHFHPLNIYRHRVIKQADTVLAMFLLGDEFSPEEKKRNFDYYDPLTTGDSSLSVCIQSIVAVEIGYLDKAYEYFNYAVSMDLADVGGNVKDGVHIASTGGTWMAAVYGFGGFRDYGGRFSFRPRLPEQWRRLRFPLTIRGQTLEVEITSASTTYTLCQGEGLTIYHDNQELRLTMTAPLILPTSPGVQSKPQLGK